MTSFEPANISNTLLEIKNMSVDYHAANGTVHALTEVSITLGRGQILGLAGESGSGKSTLAYAITRLLRPPAEIIGGQLLYYPRPRDREDSGRLKGSSRANARITPTSTGMLTETAGAGEAGDAVDILRFSLVELREFRWEELSIVFQSAMNALNPVLNVGTQITDVLRTHRPEMGADARRKRAIDLLRLVGIAPDRIKSYPHELSGGMRHCPGTLARTDHHG